MKSFPDFFQKTSGEAEIVVQDGVIYEFADFRLIPADGLLLSGDREVPLAPKAFSTLVLLVKNHGHLVSRSELIETVWAEAFVEESAVSRCVWTIRNALGEDSKAPQFIQTVPKRGYKFVAPVSVVDALTTNGTGDVQFTEAVGRINGSENGSGSLTDQPPETTVSSQPSKLVTQKRLPVVFVALAAAALAVVGFLAIYWVTTSRPLAVGSSAKIAVLPPKSLSAESRDPRYELGIADALILKLSSSKDLTVRPVHAVQPYVEKEVDPRRVGKEQQVDLVLSSNYQIADGKVRITSQLLNAATGQVEETFKFEKAVTDLFSVQDAVADEIGNKIIARLGGVPGPMRKRGTSNEEAYRHYLQGMFLSDQRNGPKAEESLSKAVALDPNYALAWAGKAHAHRTLALNRTSESREQYELSMAALNRALDLDPSLADAHSALCLNKLQYEYVAAAAEPACKRALELDPRSAIAYQSYSFLLNYSGRHDEAIAAIKTAIDLEPASFFNQRLYANTLYLARRHYEAHAQYVRLNELNRNALPTYEWAIRNLEAQGKYPEAFEWFVRSLEVKKTDDATIERFHQIYKESGWAGILREREKEYTEVNDLRRAGVNARLGNKDAAFKFLNEAYDQRSTMIPVLAVDPQFDPLREDPRFTELLKRINAK